MRFRRRGSTEGVWYRRNPQKSFQSRGVSAALKVGGGVAVVSRSIVSRSADRVTRSSALPRAHCCISGSSSLGLYSSTRPDSVAQNAFTANKTHVSDTTRCSERQCKACLSEHLPVRFAGHPLRLLETCDQHLGEIQFCVPTMVAHISQKQFVQNWIAQPNSPTKSSFQHAKV